MARPSWTPTRPTKLANHTGRPPLGDRCRGRISMAARRRNSAMRDWQPFLGLPSVGLAVRLTTSVWPCSVWYCGKPRMATPSETGLASSGQDLFCRIAGVMAACVHGRSILLSHHRTDGGTMVVTDFSRRSTEYAGYAMAATSFFAQLAYTLTQGAHIRVSMLLNGSSTGTRCSGWMRSRC